MATYSSSSMYIVMFVTLMIALRAWLVVVCAHASYTVTDCQDSIPLDRARTPRTPSATDAERNKHLHAQ